MGRGFFGGEKRTPNVKPVEKIELSEKNPTPRIIAIVALILIAAMAFAYGANKLISGESGWRDVEVRSEKGYTCADDFRFVYNIGVSGVSANTEYKKLSSLYTSAMEEIYYALDEKSVHDGAKNLAYVNQHPNEETEIDPLLYKALESFSEDRKKLLYLAPIYYDYGDLLDSESDEEAREYDPYENDSVKEYFAEVSAFINSGTDIKLELLGDNKVLLSVSDESKAFATEYGIKCYLDFYWLKNAVIIDHIADEMISAGFTRGYITSYDGYTRFFGNETLSADIVVRENSKLTVAATLNTKSKMSVVYLRNYIMYEGEKYNCYTYENGASRTRYISAADGLCRCAADMLVLYSENNSCFDIALSASEIFIADELDETSLKTLENINTIFHIGGKELFTSGNTDDISLAGNGFTLSKIK